MPDINKLFEKAEKYLQKQKFESALETYLEIYKYEPKDEEVLLNLGDLCLKLNRTAEGLRYQTQLADYYIKKNDITRAIAACRKILKASPQDVNTLMKMAGLLEKTQKTNDALEAYREARDLYRKAGGRAQVIDCLQHIVTLDPASLDAHVELAEEAVKGGQAKVAAGAFLQAAALARKAEQEDRWAQFVERAYELNPADEVACTAAAELFLKKDKAAETVALLEPIAQAKPDDLMVLDLLTRAYVKTRDYAKATPLCWKLYQTRPDALAVMLQLLEGLVASGDTEQAVKLLGQLRGRLYQEGKREDFLRIVEKIYEGDESNLPVLELLTNVYNDMNREEGLRRSLARLFNLYLAVEHYETAADTLERIIDVDPYGGGHYDRLLSLEGHIDKIWYDNIASRVEPPSTGRVTGGEAAGQGAASKAVSLDDLIIEGEMYLQYQLGSKLKETLETLNRQFPGVEEDNQRLRDLYNAAGFMPATTGAGPGAGAGAPAGAPEPGRPPASQESLEDLRRISEITSNIYREGTPQDVMQVAVNEIGRALSASRCWGALGTTGRPPTLFTEYCSPATPSSDFSAAVKVYEVLMSQAASKVDGWLMEDVVQFQVLAPVMEEVKSLGIKSLLALPLVETDAPSGLLLVEQCGSRRAWQPSETILLHALATQIVVAVKNTKLRRLVRSLAGSDEETGLLPRSSYVDCLLAEASRAKELSKPLAVCLLEPTDPATLIKMLGDAGVQRYVQQVAKALQANLRQNDIAVRYRPCSIAVVFPDTTLSQGGAAVDKLRRVIAAVKLDGAAQPDFCWVVCDVPLGLRFDAVDGVTEVVNRLEAVLEEARKEGGEQVMLSSFEG
jgi:tetratricopeptide (TPR) repeat protein/GGDEF domain-containing protein